MIRSVKGTHDILPNQTRRWQKVETALHKFMQKYGYQEIRTPAFEKTELFTRGIGEETDIVSKEMYSWTDQGGENLTLKPELTAPVVRAFIQHSLGSQAAVNRLYYMDALFRRERPQKGRTRQFYQYGAEVFGSEYPEADTEIIAISYNFYKELGLSDLTIKLNSIGSEKCRQTYRKELRNYLEPFLPDLTETSKNRFNKNPLRILDTKVEHEREIIKNAPEISNFLTDEDKSHFEEVKALLIDLSIPFTIDPQMVRGLDYYTRTTYEITSTALGAQDALCGGGRYDKLVETLGGKPTPAVGFAAGIGRLLLALESKTTELKDESLQINIIGLTEKVRSNCQVIAQELRDRGFSVSTDLLRRSLKSLLREANRNNVKITIIIGEDELANNTVLVKDMETGEQTAITKNKLINYLTDLDY
ncbi:MAG: histidine--tRNA ligase [Planctomycetia bacterium]|nr:histidine--tRNA ligase [Planctomycetia bacterium]